MKLLYSVILLTGCSLSLLAMEEMYVKEAKKEIDMKQGEVVIEMIKKEPDVATFMTQIGLNEAMFFEKLADGTTFSCVQNELEGMSPERYNALVKRVAYEKPKDARAFVMAKLIRAMRNDGLTMLGRYRIIACIGWSISTVTALGLSCAAVYAAANS